MISSESSGVFLLLGANTVEKTTLIRDNCSFIIRHGLQEIKKLYIVHVHHPHRCLDIWKVHLDGQRATKIIQVSSSFLIET